MSQELVLSSNTTLPKFVRISGNFDFDTESVRKTLDAISNTVEFNGKTLNKDEIIEFGVMLLTGFVDQAKEDIQSLRLSFECVKDGELSTYLRFLIDDKLQLNVDNYKVVTDTDIGSAFAQSVFVAKAGPFMIHRKLSEFIGI